MLSGLPRMSNDLILGHADPDPVHFVRSGATGKKGAKENEGEQLYSCFHDLGKDSGVML